MNKAAPIMPALRGAMAATLGSLAREAEEFGLALCADADVAARYLVQLQQIDRLAQSLRELAGVMAADDPRAAVREIRLGELRSNLEKALAD